MGQFLREQGIELLMGVVATFVAAAIAWWFGNHVVPTIGRIFSDDVDIAGEWSGSDSTTAGTYAYHLELKARFRRWTGLGVITRSSSPAGDYRHSFRINATKRGGYVVINLMGTKSSPGSVATGLFLLEQRGAVLRGGWVYRPSASEVPKCEDVHFRKLAG